MASDSLLSALLGQSAQERLSNDPFYVSGVGLSRQQIAPRNNTEAFLIPALQGLAAGGMQGYGRANVASSMATSPLIDALKIDRSTLDTSDPFKVENVLSQALLGNQLEQQGLGRQNDLAKAAIGQVQNPRVQKQIIEKLLGTSFDVKSPPNVGGSDGIAKPDENPFAGNSKVDPLISALTEGKESVLDRQKRVYNEMLDQGMPPTQAAVAARDAIQGENKANQGSFDTVKAAREKALAIMGLADTADTGIKLAGRTGFFPTISSGYEKLASAFGSSEAAQQTQGDALLNSIKPDIVKMSRTPGAVSDREMQSYIESAPSTSNTPEQNQILAGRIRELGKLENEYADFLSAYRDANNGSTINADKLWNQYRQAVPLFDESGAVNSKRTPWQSFFAESGQPQQSDQGSGILEQGGDSPTYSVDELVAAGYSQSDINTLKSEGMVK